MIQFLGCCITKPFSMVLEGFVDSEMSERDFIDLCCSIGESLDFCICVSKTIVEIRRFQITDDGSSFSFHVTFPDNRGTKYANREFVKDNMVKLLKCVLEDDLPVGFEDDIDYSDKKTYAIIKVP
jgi:hypothetical protein